MSRKKIMLLGGGLALLLSSLAGASIWMWPDLLSIGKPATELENSHDTAESKPKVEESRGTKAIAPADLAPAPDFKPPVTRESAMLLYMRDISKWQTALSQGDEQAGPKLKEAMLRMSTAMTSRGSGEPSVDESHAFALYVLSGGNPSEVAKLLEATKLEVPEKALLGGVVAYATSNVAEATKKLQSLDLKPYEPLLAAQLHMTLAQLSGTSDTSIEMLSVAANLAPGTLIEEAAIRRIIGHLVKRQDVKKLLYWSSRYLRRFPNSLYASDFDENFEAAVKASAADWAMVTPVQFTRLFRPANEQRRLRFSQAIMLTAVHRADVKTCAAVLESFATQKDADAKSLTDLRLLFDLCAIDKVSAEKLAAMKQMNTKEFTPKIAALIKNAASMADVMLAQGALVDLAYQGPSQPLSVDPTFATLAASVAQQMDDSLQTINQADGHETATQSKP